MNDDAKFTRGYIDGWQSLKPGSNPPGIPAYAIPAGIEAYDYGFDLGKEKAASNNGRK
ncbi:hypothetical protein [Novosphingobium sp.]|uniref:hypothetical protein n=1 Tax=Novosphingobium sp. TaxID=1874826 RepID=UPI002FDAC218